MTSPVRADVLVEAPPDDAFQVFVGRIGEWWPLDRHGVFDNGSVAFERDRLVERAGDEHAVWAEVTSWGPPELIAFTWHPGYDAEHGTEIAVTFEAVGDEQTLVSLEHTGWEKMSDPDASAEQYRSGWPAVLDAYAALVAAR